MKLAIVAAAMLSVMSTHVLAQTSTDPETPAVVTPDDQNPSAPVEGENSFTEAQAQDRIKGAGYTDVSALKLNGKGIWRGTAMKDGKSVAVGLDYQGNVVTE
jgi:hypothetical protein